MKKDKSKIQLGTRLKAFRQSKNLTQLALSRQIHIDRSSLAHYEAGDRLPDISILIDIADYLELSLDTLVGRDLSFSDHKSVEKPN